MHHIKSLFISFLVNIVSIFFRRQIRSNTMSMVFSGGTEVNKNLTSNDTMLNPCGILTFSPYS